MSAKWIKIICSLIAATSAIIVALIYTKGRQPDSISVIDSAQKHSNVSQKIEAVSLSNNHDNSTTTPASIKSSNPFDIGAFFSASGWMGDGEAGTRFIKLNEAYRRVSHSSPSCIKIDYRPGSKDWGGIYWLNKPDNWGDFRGKNLADKGYKQVSFWARGEQGGEIVEFKAGGINAPGKEFRDSFEVSVGKVELEKKWKKYTMNLEGEDLSNVIGGFCWVAAKSGNPEGLTFYLDDIIYE